MSDVKGAQPSVFLVFVKICSRIVVGLNVHGGDATGQQNRNAGEETEAAAAGHGEAKSFEADEDARRVRILECPAR